MEVPTDAPLTQDQAFNYFRDVVAGIEYCTYCTSLYLARIASTATSARGGPFLLDEAWSL